MQLDQTEIAVRERGILEIFDLALHVTRIHWRPVVVMFALGAVPLSVLNYFLIGWMIDFEIREDPFLRYLWLLIALTAIEGPLAGVFLTSYLGKAVFQERPRWRDVLADVGRAWLRLLLSVVVLRGLLPAWLLLLSLDRLGEPNYGVEIGLMMMLLMGVTALRLFRPFITEIILLEKNPLVARGDSLTVGRRSARLHGPASGELFLRGLTSGLFLLLLAPAVCYALLFVMGVFSGDWSMGRVNTHLVLPAGLWATVAFMTVARFLNYLDIRMRQEGWEVELRIRAEAARLAARIT